MCQSLGFDPFDLIASLSITRFETPHKFKLKHSHKVSNPGFVPVGP